MSQLTWKMATGSQAPQTPDNNPLTLLWIGKSVFQWGEYFVNREVAFITSGNRNCQVRFLTQRRPTNEQTFCWAMSKPKDYLKDWHSSDFSGCFVIISLLVSQLGLGDSPEWNYMQGAHAKIWRHNNITKHWLKAYSAFLQRLPVSFNRYWNSRAIISFKYFYGLIKYLSNFETDLAWIRTISNIRYLNIQNNIHANWQENKPTKIQTLQKTCSSVSLFHNCKRSGENY